MMAYSASFRRVSTDLCWLLCVTSADVMLVLTRLSLWLAGPPPAFEDTVSKEASVFFWCLRLLMGNCERSFWGRTLCFFLSV